MRDALGASYPTGFGQLLFNVVTPTIGSMVDDAPTWGPPAVDGIALHSATSGNDIEWAHEYAALIPESFKPATALLRVGITLRQRGSGRTRKRGSRTAAGRPD
jgi:hypothetical protein